MKKSITAQLFFVLLGLSFVAILGVILTTSFSLHSRFNEYTEEQDRQYAQTVGATLSEFYQQFGGWELIRNNPWIWRDIIHMGELQKDSTINAPSIPNQAPSAFTPDQINPQEQIKRRSLSHWSLLDAKNKLIVGNPNVNNDSLKIPILNKDKMVGTLVLSKNQRVNSLLEFRFLQKQAQSSLWILLFATTVSFIAALLLARRFVAPIKKIAAATKELTTGKFDIDLSIERDDEFGQLARDFNVLSKTLSTNETLRRQFIADISHELRTPLSILSGELEAIQDGIRPANKEAINSLKQEVNALTHLVDDLYQLALSEIGQLKYDFSEQDLSHIITESIERFREKFEQQQLKIECTGLDHPVLVSGDANRLNQLFYNLFENAIRYTDKGGKLNILLVPSADKLTLIIEDSAPGVSEEEAILLFNRFYRVEQSRNRATGGAGLGLALCYTIIQAHKGNITAGSSLLGGLKITITLPVVKV